MKNIERIDWQQHSNNLNEKGFSIIPGVLSRAECEHIAGFYSDQHLYRNTIDMRRYRFGMGEYKYFRYPLPPVVQCLREEFYKPLSTIANRWMQVLSIEKSFPSSHQKLIEQCNSQLQNRPTPLILRYTPGGFNTLHQDLYGEIYFPFQVVFVLTQHGRDHEGGELVLAEQVPRAQSKAEVLKPDQGDAVIFTTNFRPVKGTRGYYRANMKHGVSEVKSGERYALGIIFHDAV